MENSTGRQKSLGQPIDTFQSARPHPQRRGLLLEPACICLHPRPSVLLMVPEKTSACFTVPPDNHVEPTREFLAAANDFLRLSSSSSAWRASSGETNS